MNWRCFFKGHKHTESTYYFVDPVCDCCGKHDYFDSIHADPGCKYVKSYFHSYEFTIPTLLSIPKIWFKHRFESVKCAGCKKYYKRFGFEVGNHDNCLPF